MELFVKSVFLFAPLRVGAAGSAFRGVKPCKVLLREERDAHARPPGHASTAFNDALSFMVHYGATDELIFFLESLHASLTDCFCFATGTADCVLSLCVPLSIYTLVFMCPYIGIYV